MTCQHMQSQARVSKMIGSALEAKVEVSVPAGSEIQKALQVLEGSEQQDLNSRSVSPFSAPCHSASSSSLCNPVTSVPCRSSFLVFYLPFPSHPHS